MKDLILNKEKILFKYINGERERNKLNLEEKDFDEFNYNIIISKNTKTISISYFLGLFEKSIKKIGFKKFKEKYKFKTDNHDLKKDIEEAIEWIIN